MPLNVTARTALNEWLQFVPARETRLFPSGRTDRGLTQIMGHDSLDTTRSYTQGTAIDLRQEVEKIAWQ